MQKQERKLEIITKIKTNLNFGLRNKTRDNFLFLLDFLLNHLFLKDRSLSLRALYYELFERAAWSYNQVVSRLNRLCQHLSIPREAFGVFADSNFFVFGRLKLLDKNNGRILVDASLPSEIPAPLCENISDINFDLGREVEKVVLFEKKAVFDRAVDYSCRKNTLETIFLCGKGFPTFGARKFIRAFPGTIFVLVDCDFHGCLIFESYKKAGGNKIQYIGAFVKDYRENLNHFPDLSQREMRLLKKSIEKNTWGNNKVDKNIKMIYKFGKKLEIEVFRTKGFVSKRF